MAIGNINAKIVNRMTTMYDVDSQSQHPSLVACLLNAVAVRGNTFLKIVLLMLVQRLRTHIFGNCALCETNINFFRIVSRPYIP